MISVDEMLVWLKDGNCVQCRDPYEREAFLALCAEHGYRRGFQNIAGYEHYLCMYLSSRTSEIQGIKHPILATSDNTILFSDVEVRSEPSWESIDPGILYGFEARE